MKKCLEENMDVDFLGTRPKEAKMLLSRSCFTVLRPQDDWGKERRHAIGPHFLYCTTLFL